VAEFVSKPVADGEIVATSVYVAVPPARSETVEAMLPIPLAAPQLDPAVAAHVHVADEIAAGSVSATGAFVTELGPAFETAIVYVVVVPGITVTTPSVFVIERSPCEITGAESVEESLPGVVSPPPDTAAVLSTGFGAAWRTFTLTVIGAYEPPGARTFDVVHVTTCRTTLHAQSGAPDTAVGRSPAGTASATVTVPAVGAAVALARLETASVYVAVEPRTNVGGRWVFRIVRSGAMTSVGVVDELLPGTGSFDEDVTVAVFEIDPATEVWTKRVTVAVSPGAMLPRAHVTVVVPEHEPWDGVAETKVVPAGRTSDTVAPVAVPGPLFVTTIVYRTFEPA
jgi:hypothetical protein